MKIQDMKSGILHLDKRPAGQARENLFVVPPSREVARSPDCELEEPLWSVVSFHRCEGSCLTYDRAAELMAELDRRRAAGLCIVTDAAAKRIGD